jgi:hypothetical protein
MFILMSQIEVVFMLPFSFFPGTFSFRATSKDGKDPPPLLHAEPPTGKYTLPNMSYMLSHWWQPGPWDFRLRGCLLARPSDYLLHTDPGPTQ